MVGTLGAVFAFVFVFGLVVFVHELGHFLAAKAVGVYAPRFSIGFGPALWSRKWGETEYVLAAIPLGGYVRMASREDETMAFLEGGGEHPVADVSTTGGSGSPAHVAPGEASPRYWDPNGTAPFGPNPVPEQRLFESKSLPARLLIMFAGVFMNMVLGFVVLTGLAMVYGEPVLATRVVGAVHEVPGAPALAGLAAGDTIRAIDGRAVQNWGDVLSAIDSGSGTAVRIATQRGAVDIPVGDDAPLSRKALIGAIEPSLPPVIDQVVQGKPADMAGLQSGDSIVAVNGEPVANWSQVAARIRKSPGVPMRFDVVREGKRHTLTVRPDSTTRADPVTGRDELIGQIWAAGKAPEDRLRLSAGESVGSGWRVTKAITVGVVFTVRDLFTGRASVKNLRGPIGIAQAAYTAARSGFEELLGLVALLSINVAVLNLLPIPILDGGQIVLNVVETVRGGTFSPRTREYIVRFGLLAIVLIFAIVMYNDIVNGLRSLFRLPSAETFLDDYSPRSFCRALIIR